MKNSVKNIERKIELDDETWELVKKHFHTEDPEPFIDDLLAAQFYGWDPEFGARIEEELGARPHLRAMCEQARLMFLCAQALERAIKRERQSVIDANDDDDNLEVCLCAECAGLNDPRYLGTREAHRTVDQATVDLAEQILGTDEPDPLDIVMACVYCETWPHHPPNLQELMDARPEFRELCEALLKASRAAAQ